MKKFFASTLAALFFLGCTKQAWVARIYMVRAEEVFSKAHAMRVRKNDSAYKQRLEFYREACDNFSRAYRINPETYTLNRIEEAIEACLRVEDFKDEEIFRQFEEEYAKNHPDETKYGDAGAYMNLES